MTSIYLTAFILGFFTSFGWWSAGKVQRAIDNTPVTITIETEQPKNQ